MIESKSVVSWGLGGGGGGREEQEGGITKEHLEIYWGAGYIYYLDYGDNFMSIYVC